MKKLFLFLSLGIFFTVVSCDKSTKTEGLLKSTEQKSEFTLIKGQNAIPIQSGATSMNVELPNGQTIEVDIPVEFQLNEDGTPKAEKPAASRSGACSNVVTVYPFSSDSFTQSNVNSITINYAGSPVITGINQGTTSYPTPLNPGDILKVSVDVDSNTGCNDILLIVGSWDCSGGKFDFMQMEIQGDFTNIDMGSLSICYGKCGLNPIWTILQTIGC